MKITIFGSGAVGGYFGARLAQAGLDVAFVARGAHLKALQTNGLRIDSIQGDAVVDAVRASDDAHELGIADVVIVAVKSWQLDAAIVAMRPLVGESTMIVPLLNGVEAPGRLASEFGPKRVVGGLCSLVSMVVAPGHIRHAGALPLIQFGELDNEKTARVKALYDAFACAVGLQVEMPDNIETAMWQKFLLIASWSGVGAATRAPVGSMRTVPETRTLLHQAMDEVLSVARGRHVPMPDTAVAEALAFIDALPGDATASMQRDMMAGRRSELDAQTGAVVRLGKQAGICTPVNTTLYACLLPMELSTRA